MLAARSDGIAFIVLLAGPGIPGDALLLMQQEAIGRASGTDEKEIQTAIEINRKLYDIIIRTADTVQLYKEIELYLRQAIAQHPGLKPEGMSEEAFIHPLMQQVSSPWIRYFLRYDPAAAFGKVKCPVLALNGEKDLQVSSGVNLEAIRKAVKNGKLTAEELPGLNHLFQECSTGLMTEYSTIEQTFSPAALDIILNWIKNQTR
jgi:pimeloyl-ACP methyl ester carboxylesterase